MNQLLHSLNDQQQRAATHIDGPLLILAGAGSGKTTTITTRLTYLLKEVGIPSSQTLTLTFTNKAAKEMRQRALSMLDDISYPPLLCTFHKFGLLFLKFHIQKLGRSNDFVVIDTDDKKRIIKQLSSEVPPALIASEISRYKNSLLSPQQAFDQAQLQTYKHIAKCYETYEAHLVQNNLVDFDDLLALSYKILDEDEALAHETSQRYRYIMVDEYQDTNTLQFELLKKLCLTHNNLCVVGDDDQSIYGWRGAHIRNILEFDQDFSGVTTIKLEHNYRSKAPILETANTLIAHNQSRLGKKLIATRSDGEKVQLIHSNDESIEAMQISKKIQALIDQGVRGSDIAVLYRVNALSRSLEEGLNRAHIGYTLVGGLRFYERAEIKDIIAYIRLIVNEEDDFSFKRIINKPKRAIGKTTLEKLEQAATASRCSLFSFIEKSSDEALIQLVKKRAAGELKAFAKKLRHLQGSASKAIYDFIEQLESTFLIKKIYQNTPDEQDRIQNIDEFYALFRDFVIKSPELGLNEFLNELTLQSDQDQVQGESIFIMSIHAAKGLEFTHLFVIGLEDGFLPLTGDSSNLEEERRLGYVAMTRAKDTLTLSSVQSRFYKGQRKELPRSRFLSEAGLIEGSLNLDEGLTQGFKKGDLVRHKIFGAGRITGVSKVGRECKLSINFGGNRRDILSSFVERL